MLQFLPALFAAGKTALSNPAVQSFLIDQGGKLISKKAGEGSGEAFSSVFKNLLSSRKGGSGGGAWDEQIPGMDTNPYMAAINGMGDGEIDDTPTTSVLNTMKESYVPPQLMGFPSMGRSGYGQAVQKALAATRGF